MITPEEHWRTFIQFATLDMATGGPDSHMRTVGHMIRNHRDSRRWEIGCYIAVYNVPGGEWLWNELNSWDETEMERPELEEWIREDWSRIPFRRERRAVRTPKKLAIFLRDYRRWLPTLDELALLDLPPEELYEKVWDSARKNIKYLGRYSAFKLLEALERYGEIPIRLPDIRARGGWSPRMAMNLLWGTNHDPQDDRLDACLNAEILAQMTKDKVLNTFGLHLDYYTLEVFLCDYRQVLARRQYPGRSLDSELDHWAKAGHDDSTEMFRSRAALFPTTCLGETSGWDGVRKELRPLPADHGYMWSDLLFCYSCSTLDLENPIARARCNHDHKIRSGQESMGQS